MGGQTISDGIDWALPVFVPSVASVLLVYIVKAFYGDILAGSAWIGITIILFVGFLGSAKYWHIPSTVGFLLGGLVLWMVMPSAIAPIVPWPFEVLYNMILFLFFVFIARQLLNKVS
jgi:hypothetical protein